MFDPYRKWLGLPADQRPPTYYQLLGLAHGEADVEIIEEAAIRQSTHVRAYQIGPHSQECTRLLNEIALARATLTNPTKRQQYDATLAQQQKKNAVAAKAIDKSDEIPVDAFAAIDDPLPASEPARAKTKPRKPKARTNYVPFAIAGGVVVLLGVVLIVVLTRPRAEVHIAREGDPSKEKPNPKPIPKKTVDPVVEPKDTKPPDVKVVKDKTNPEDAKLAAKFVGRYLLSYSGAATGAGSGTTRWQFSETRALENGEDKGAWRVEDGKVILTYTQATLGQAVLEFKNDDTLIGKHRHGKGWIFDWVLEREGSAKTKLSPPIDFGMEAMGPSPLDQLDPARIGPGDRLPKIPELVAVLKGAKREVFCVAISPDGKKIACADNGGNALVWDVTGAAPGTAAEVGPAGAPVSSIAFSPDSKNVAYADGGTVRIYGVAPPELKQEIPLRVGQFPGIAYSPDGNTLAITDRGSVQLLDPATRMAKSIRVQAPGVRSVSFNRDGSRLLTALGDGTARVWNLKVDPPEQLFVCKGMAGLFYAAFSPDGKAVALGDMAGQVSVWDIGGLQAEQRWAKREHRQWANSVAFAPDGKSLISTEGGGSPQGPHYLIWWNAANGEILKKWEMPERASQGTFAPRGLYVAVTCHNHNVYVLRIGRTDP